MEFAEVMRTARELFGAAVAAVDTRAAVRRSLRLDGDRLIAGEGADSCEVPLPPGGRIVVAAVGKAAAAMAAAAEEVLGERITAGLALTKYGCAEPTRIVRVREAGHPTPDQAGLAGAAELRALLTGLRPDDLVLCLLSGGGSALLTAPVPPVGLAELRDTTAALLRAGATINELNAVRKHLEALKGGGLAALAAPARVVALVVSDVLGDPLDVIASGPTVGDPDTFADAWRVVERHGLGGRLPPGVAARLEAGLRGEVPDTPRPDDPLFARVRTIVVANLRRAAEGAAGRAAELGWTSRIGDLTIEGEAREVARSLVAGALASPPEGGGVRRCLIGGGETTVTVRGDRPGLGGRNTELALAAALAIDGRPGLAVAALATDGDDGPTGAAGAVATGETVGRGRALGLDAADFLARHDSATFFARVGGLLVTGPTRTNVADLYCLFQD